MCYRNFDWKLKYDSLLLLVRCDSTETPFESGNDGVSEQKDGDDDGDVMVGNFSKVILNLGSSW